MAHSTPAERCLFSDLTRLFMSMRDAPHTQLEAMIEERFRDFVRANPEQGVGGLQITLSWTLPDGADEWAVYGTEYRTIPTAHIAEPRQALAGNSAAILDLPVTRHSRPVAPGGASARIISFPTP